MDAKKRRKLAAVLSAAAVTGGVLYLVLGSFQDSLVYFYTPTELHAKELELEGKKIRLAGLVQPGTLIRSADKTSMEFYLTDATHSVAVTFKGVTPDLFAEGQMAVAEGRPKGGKLVAEAIMAKHSEDYDSKRIKMPNMNGRKPQKW